MTIELRAVTADDWQLWRLTRLAALADAPDAFGSRLQDWADAPEERWRERLSIPGAVDLLAFDACVDGAVGMATGTRDRTDDGNAELISMWVAPAARGRGVATTLISAIAEWAASTGARTLTLSVMSDNVAARRTYERNRFIASPEPGELRPGRRCELVMLRHLATSLPSTPRNASTAADTFRA